MTEARGFDELFNDRALSYSVRTTGNRHPGCRAPRGVTDMRRYVDYGMQGMHSGATTQHIQYSNHQTQQRPRNASYVHRMYRQGGHGAN